MTTPSVTSTQQSLSLEEWVTAIDEVIDYVVADARLPLLRSDLQALRARLGTTTQERDTATPLINLQIQTVMPDSAFPVARVYARTIGTLLALHMTDVASAPRGTTLAALWSPGILTPLVVMHPLESYRLRQSMGAWVRDGDLLLEGVFADAVRMIDDTP